ncbi:activating signal cointegrator 1 complex subunit [Anaeramoeba flamelloides]|uniref:Activating signal cointegrator 1 complex subunit n=1 Tax=Anaeramoeba flamelloides TaxID=1746091 RepID=A0AAV8A565_9EUKA|nr:activating signal cointegrator 1 complex subunit [Anaeramoeba flamelloides]
MTNETTSEVYNEVIKHPWSKGYLLRKKVEPYFYGFITGKNNKTITKIIQNHKVRIELPDELSGKLYYSITGMKKDKIQGASDEMDKIIKWAIPRLNWTHFVSIPLLTKKMRNSMKSFQKSIHSTVSVAEGFSEEIMQSPYKFHLTILMMKLYKEEQRDKAIEILKQVKIDGSEGVLNSEITIKSLSTFPENDFENCQVMYAQVQQDETFKKIHRLHLLLIEKFQQAGIEVDTNPLTLHATLMNYRYKIQKNNQKKQNTINFSKLKENNEFLNYNFGTQIINQIHLSTLGKYHKSGFYMPHYMITNK